MDIYLKLMMEGALVTRKKASSTVKSRFDIAIERAAEEYASSQVPEEWREGRDQLLNLQMQRTRLVEEFKEMMTASALEKYIEEAFSILIKEGRHYIGNEAYELLLKSLAQIEPCLAEFNLETDQTFQEIFKMKDSVLESIFNLARSKFSEQSYTSALALFVLLTTLSSHQPAYWYRLGIAAQRAGNIDLALEAYEVTCSLDPAMLGPWIFSVECLLSLGVLDKAQVNFQKAQEIFKTRPDIDPTWQEIITKTEEGMVGALNQG